MTRLNYSLQQILLKSRRRNLFCANGAKKVAESLARFIGKRVSGVDAGLNAVEAKVAKIHTNIAPGRQRPDRSPKMQGKRPNGPRGLSVLVVTVSHPQNRLIVYGGAKHLQ